MTAIQAGAPPSSADDARRDRPGPPVPPPRRQRRVSLILVGLLTVAGGALGVASLVSNVTAESAVLVLARPIRAGQEVTPRHVTTARVESPDRLNVLDAGNRDSILGLIALVDLDAGTPLARTYFSAESVVGDGEALVAIPVGTQDIPGEELKAGQRVRIVAAPPELASIDGEPPRGPTTWDGRVFAVRHASSDSAAIETTTVSVIVTEGAAADIAAAVIDGRVRIVLLGGRGGVG